MARPDKAATVAELANRFTTSNGAVLTEYRGLTVKALKDLRRSLGDDATYAVSKNTLTQIAAKQAGIDGIDEHLVGPTAIAFIDGDPVNVAKGLRDFAKANPLLVIKGGILDGNVLSSDEVRKLADLESREVLLAKMAGALQASLQNAVSLFAAPLAQAARALGALQQAAADDPTLIGGAGEQPASAPEATEAAPAAEASSDSQTTSDTTSNTTSETTSETSADAAASDEN